MLAAQGSIRLLANLLIPARPMDRRPAMKPVKCRKRQTSQVVLAAQGSVVVVLRLKFGHERLKSFLRTEWLKVRVRLQLRDILESGVDGLAERAEYA